MTQKEKIHSIIQSFCKPTQRTLLRLNGLPKTYLITNVADGLTKIGRSKNPYRRIRDLRCKICRMYICDADIEQFLHTVCVRKSRGYEWYELTEREIQYIVQKYDFYPVDFEQIVPPTEEELKYWEERSNPMGAWDAQEEFNQFSKQ